MMTKFVLCVTRESDSSSELHQRMRAKDLGVVTCESLDKAMRIIELGRPELILLQEAPGIMDGVPLLAEFLGNRWPGTPILVEEAGRSAEETVRRCCSMLGLKD